MISEDQYRKAYLAFLSAKGFLSAANAIRQLGKDGVKLFTYYAYPLSVNAAFACELFLKALLTLEGVEYKKLHLLFDLFASLPESTKAGIKNEFSNRGSKESVDGLVNTYSNAFVEWRYTFEDENASKVLPMVWTDFLILCMVIQIETKKKLKSFSWFDDYNIEGEK